MMAPRLRTAGVQSMASSDESEDSRWFAGFAAAQERAVNSSGRATRAS